MQERRLRAGIGYPRATSEVPPSPLPPPHLRSVTSAPILRHLLQLPTTLLHGPLAAVVDQLHHATPCTLDTMLGCGSALPPGASPARYHLAVTPRRPDALLSNMSLVLPSPGLAIAYHAGAIPPECLRLLDALFHPGRSLPPHHPPLLEDLECQCEHPGNPKTATNSICLHQHGRKGVNRWRKGGPVTPNRPPAP